MAHVAVSAAYARLGRSSLAYVRLVACIRSPAIRRADSKLVGPKTLRPETRRPETRPAQHSAAPNPT